MNDLIHFAMERACVIFGSSDGIFNSACFSAAFEKVSGVKRTLDGWIVTAIMVGRTDVKIMPGGSHWKIVDEIKCKTDFATRMRAKMKERVITASEFLDNMTEFLCNTEGLTTEKLREDLEAEGIDIPKVLHNTEAMLRKYGFHKAADRMTQQNCSAS